MSDQQLEQLEAWCSRQSHFAPDIATLEGLSAKLCRQIEAQNTQLIALIEKINAEPSNVQSLVDQLSDFVYSSSRDWLFNQYSLLELTPFIVLGSRFDGKTLKPNPMVGSLLLWTQSFDTPRAQPPFIEQALAFISALCQFERHLKPVCETLITIASDTKAAFTAQLTAAQDNNHVITELLDQYIALFDRIYCQHTQTADYIEHATRLSNAAQSMQNALHQVVGEIATLYGLPTQQHLSELTERINDQRRTIQAQQQQIDLLQQQLDTIQMTPRGESS